MVRPRVAVIAPTPAVMERFEKTMSAHASITAVCADETDDKTLEKIDNVLSNFSVDVVVVAPACSHMQKSITLPPSWDGIPVDQVVLEAKPVSALTTVWTQSWLTKQRGFPLDGSPTL